MQLRDIMQTRVKVVAPNESARAAWTLMRRENVRHLVVTDGDRIEGVISERDLGGREGTRLRKGRRVRHLMTPQVVTATPDMSVRAAADLMRSRLIGSLPVTDDGRLAGLVTATDVFESLGRESLRLSQAERQLLRRPTSSKALGGRPVPRTRAKARPAKRRRSQAEKRAPFAEQVPRPVKRTAGRTSASLVPANIRVAGVDVSDAKRDNIRKRLGRKLGKFATAIERVSVRLRDVNGPRGGVDHECQIKVVLSGAPSIVVAERDASLSRAITAAMNGAEVAVRRAVQRRRTTPIKKAVRRARRARR